MNLDKTNYDNALTVHEWLEHDNNHAVAVFAC